MKGLYDDVANQVNEESVISASERNNKVGFIMGINTMSGESPYIKKDGTVLTTYPGTCGGCCELCEGECYARDYCMVHHNVCIPAYIKNTEIMRKYPQNYADQVVAKWEKAKQKYLRWHESGEFELFRQMVTVEDVAIRVPRKRQYFYTKKFNFIERMEESGGFSDNVSPIMSIWYKDGKRNYDNPYNYPEFIYDDGSVPELDQVWHCPSVFIDGTSNKAITCEKCGKCPNAKKRGEGEKPVQIAVYAHGKTKWHREGVDVKKIAEEQKAKWERIKLSKKKIEKR